MKLSIVVPFYNEEKNILLVLEAFAAQVYIKEHPAEVELICVNDGSKDFTESIFKKIENNLTYPFARFISYAPNGGYGNAILTGVRSARGDVIAWTHSDLQTDPADVFRALNLYNSLENQKSFIKGIRVGRPLPQVIFSFGMATIASVLFMTPLFEINAQPKLFGKDFITELAEAPRDFSLDLYALYRAKKRGYTIKTIPVKFKKRIHGESSWNGTIRVRIKTILRTLKYMWKISRKNEKLL